MAVQLYIPFWIYSNVKFYIAIIVSVLLYIPFWIYSNKISVFAGKHVWNLYIPFWIYSNVGAIGGFVAMAFFTFHSGYIPMQKLKRKKGKKLILYIPFWIYSN